MIRHGRSTLFSLGFALLASGALAAESPARTAASRSADVSDDARELRRILHLANGQTIRVVSRKRGDLWEYKSKDAWKSVEADFVARVVPESEVLREWRKRSDACDARDVAARIELARFALDEGLTVEGLGLADAILALAPDDARVLALLERPELVHVPSLDVAPDRIEAAREALYRFGASMPAAAREIAVRELGRSGATDALRAELARELSSSIVKRRSFAALALRRLFPKAEVKPLILHAVLDGSAEVREASSLALRAVDEPGVIAPIARVLTQSQSPELRAHAAEALGVMGYAAAVEPLMHRLIAASAPAASAAGSDDPRIAHSYIFVGRQIAYLQDFDVEVAQFAAVADPNINTLLEGDTLEAAVLGVQQVNVTVELATIRNALARITKADVGNTSKDWIAWWRANADRWRSVEASELEQRSAPVTGQG